MKKVLAIVLCLTLALVCFAACQSGTPTTTQGSNTGTSDPSSQQDTPEYYKCAYIGPFTGDSQQYGETHKRAIDYTINEINEAGGVNGVPLKVDYYDDKNDSKETVTLANKVVLDDEVLICFGPFASTNALAAAPVFEKAQITLCSPSASHQDFVKQGEYMVTGSVAQTNQQNFFAHFIYEDMGLGTTALLCLNDDVGNTTIDIFTHDYEELGGEVVYSESFQKGTKDFSPMLSQVKAANPDIFYPYGTYADVAQIAIQARQLDITVPMISHGSNVKQEFIDVGGDAVEGFICLTPIDPDYPDEKFQAFMTDFKATYPDYAVDSHTLALYDQVHMWAQALEKYGPDRAKINEYMRNQTQYDGIIADYDVVDGDPRKPLMSVVVKDGVFTTYTPENG